MWYLIAAMIGSSSLIVILKMFQLKNVNNVVGIMVNYAVAAVLSFIFAPKINALSDITSAPWFGFAVLIGIMFMLSFMVFALSAQRSGVAITAISGRAAMAIPVIFAFTVLGEQATTLKIIMLILLLAAMPLIMYKKKPAGETKANNPLWVMLLPLAVFLFNGTNDTMVQYAQRTTIAEVADSQIFTGAMFVVGVITAVIYYFIAYRKKLYKPHKQDLIWGAILGAANWLTMYGVLHALVVMDGSVFYPLYYTGAIICATIAGVLAFREKLTALNYTGIAITICEIVILAMQ